MRPISVPSQVRPVAAIAIIALAGCVPASGGGTTTTTAKPTTTTAKPTTTTSKPTTTTAKPTTTTSKPTTTTAKPTTTTVDPATRFDIEVRFVGAPTTAMRTQAQAAVDRWESVIVGDLAPSVFDAPAGSCLAQSPALKKTVDDIVIDVVVTPIDGAGGVLGQAGPCSANGANDLPNWGALLLDSADAASLISVGQFDDVVLHELGHTLGCGTMWEYNRKLVDRSIAASPRFVGTNAKARWAALGGSGSGVPIETTGGAGTAGVHWSEADLRNELMSGYISPINPLSRVTIASMKDLGYGVNESAADPFALGSIASAKAASTASQPLQLELEHNLVVRQLAK